MNVWTDYPNHSVLIGAVSRLSITPANPDRSSWSLYVGLGADETVYEFVEVFSGPLDAAKRQLVQRYESMASNINQDAEAFRGATYRQAIGKTPEVG